MVQKRVELWRSCDALPQVQSDSEGFDHSLGDICT